MREGEVSFQWLLVGAIKKNGAYVVGAPLGVIIMVESLLVEEQRYSLKALNTLIDRLHDLHPHTKGRYNAVENTDAGNDNAVFQF